jgi:hypothetical protein
MLKKLGKEDEAISSSNTKMGDWYVDYLYRSPFHLALFTSEKSLLPIIIPATPLDTIFYRFKNQLTLIFRIIGINERLIENEILNMQDGIIMKTRSRSILGTMNDVKYCMGDYKYNNDPTTLINLTMEMAEMPCQSIIPIDQTRKIMTK